MRWAQASGARGEVEEERLSGGGELEDVVELEDAGAWRGEGWKGRREKEKGEGRREEKEDEECWSARVWQ